MGVARWIGGWSCRFWTPDHERRTNSPRTTAGRFEQDFDFHARGLASGDSTRQRYIWMVGGSQTGVLRMAVGSSRVSGAQACEWRIESGGSRMEAGSSIFSGTQACERRIQSDDWEMEAHAKRSGRRLHWSISREMALEIWTSAMATLPRGGEESIGTMIEKDTLIAKGGSHSFIHSFVHSFSRQR